jgi:predicted alpha/beta-hydrolase family hydrolase
LILLAHGAGSDRDHSTLVALAQAFPPCERMDFPYRKAGKKLPDKAEVAVAAIVEAAGKLETPLFLGGRSFGGRMCSLAVAQGLRSAGLILLSYPLHPPGKPDRMRTEHFPLLRCPCLFITGLRDPFGTPAEFELALRPIPGPVTTVWLPGGHEPKNQDAAIVKAVGAWLKG